MIPTTAFSLGVFLLLVVPGIVYSRVRVASVGYRGPDLTAAGQGLDALFISVLFDAVYLAAYGAVALAIPDLLTVQQIASRYPLISGAASIVLFLIVPAGVSAATHRVDWIPTKRGPAWLRRPSLGNAYRSTPSGWDHNALTNTQEPSFVRVRLADGVWVGGWFSTDSYMSTYPVAPDLFIESAWKMDADGGFVSKVPNTRGVWVAIPPGTVVEWVADPTEEGPDGETSTAAQ